MYNFVSGFGWIRHLNAMILKYRILSRAKRIGVRNFGSLFGDLAEMTAEATFWLLFITLGSSAIGLSVNFFGPRLDENSAVIFFLVIALFLSLRFVCKKTLKTLILHALVSGTKKVTTSK